MMKLKFLYGILLKKAIRGRNYKRIDEILLNSNDNSNIITELDKAGDTAIYWAHRNI